MRNQARVYICMDIINKIEWTKNKQNIAMGKQGSKQALRYDRKYVSLKQTV